MSICVGAEIWSLVCDGDGRRWHPCDVAHLLYQNERRIIVLFCWSNKLGSGLASRDAPLRRANEGGVGDGPSETDRDREERGNVPRDKRGMQK
jgi:hypothetical protein